VFDAVRGGNADEACVRSSETCCCRCCFTRASPRTRRCTRSPSTTSPISLVRKLGNRVPAVLAGESISLDEQLAQWEERKALEKRAKSHLSVIDDVPTGQPALALAQKVIERITPAGLPADLIRAPSRR